MMRRIFKVLKILLPAGIAIIVLSAVLAHTLDIKPLQGIIEGVKGIRSIQPEKNKNENINAGNKEENTGNENKKPETQTENNQTAGDTENKKSEDNPDEYFMTFKEINSIENIDLHDKLMGLSIISKINKDDLQKIYKLADGGITIDELKELKKILDRNLSKSEIEKLDELLMKNKKLYAEGRLTK